ncbi:MAG TPA: DUF1566 domain-containing protein [Polyangia bacterium]|nr:DUF1566 domain-containing protein [Polyangia bacterium]
MPNSQEDVNDGAPNLEVYHDNGDGTVTDSITGLMWQQAVSAMNYPLSSAVSYCTSLTLGNHSDWRVPSLVELLSIVDFDSSSPAINTIAFPSTPPADSFLSSTLVGGSATQVGSVFFGNGTTTTLEGTLGDVRCVR